MQPVYKILFLPNFVINLYGKCQNIPEFLVCKSIFAVKNGGLISYCHNFVTISGRKFTENAEKPGRRAPERVPLPGFLSIKWHMVFKMKAHRRPVPGCGSQRMLHALERRSHSADHGPSFASLFLPLAAVSSAAIPVRVKLKTPLRNAAAATTLDIPSRWDPRTKQQPTGLIAYPAAQGRVPSIPRTGCMKKSLILRSGILFMTRTGIEPMLQP